MDARLGAVAHLKGWGFDGFGGAATCAFTFARTRSFVAGSDPNMSSVLVTLTSQARIVSGAEATCELPALDPSLAPPGARLAVSATLALHGGAVSVTAPTPILAVAADAAPGASALELADNLQVSRRASSALLAYVRGAKEGGLAVVALRTRAKTEAENEGAASFDRAATRAFPDLMSGGIDAACAFGTVVVAARRLGARRVECVSPAAPRENATAPLAATARAAGARRQRRRRRDARFSSAFRVEGRVRERVPRLESRRRRSARRAVRRARGVRELEQERHANGAVAVRGGVAGGRVRPRGRRLAPVAPRRFSVFAGAWGERFFVRVYSPRARRRNRRVPRCAVRHRARAGREWCAHRVRSARGREGRRRRSRDGSPRATLPGARLRSRVAFESRSLESLAAG